MAFYLAINADYGIFGRPEPAPGARVVFDPELMFAAREQAAGHPVAHTLDGTDGLVVHENPVDVLTWPSQLWRVADLDRPVRLRPEARWLRCRALTVLEELPVWLVLGRNGEAVLGVIEQARVLTDAQARTIAAAVPDGAGDWLTGWTVRAALANDGGRGPNPIGQAAYRLNSAVQDAARAAGEHLLKWDEEDGVQVVGDPAWQLAGKAAFATMVVHGMPAIEDRERMAALARPWLDVMGPPR